MRVFGTGIVETILLDIGWAGQDGLITILVTISSSQDPNELRSKVLAAEPES